MPKIIKISRRFAKLNKKVIKVALFMAHGV